MIQQKPASYSALRFLAFIPAAFLLITRLWPMLNAFAAAFKDVSLARGIWNSEWVGLANFNRLFATEQFGQAVRNSLLYGAAPLVFGGLLAFLSAVFVKKLRSPIKRAVVLSAGLLLSFLPEQLLLEGVLRLGMAPLSGLYELGYVLSGVIHQAGLAVLLGAAGALLAENSGRRILRQSGTLLFLCLQLAQLFGSYMPAFELMRFSRDGGSLFGLFFQYGLVSTNFSLAYTVGVVTNLLQLLPTAGAVLFLLFALHRPAEAEPQIAAKSKMSGRAFLSLGILCGVFLLISVLVSLLSKGAGAEWLPGATITSLFYTAIGAVVFTIYALPGAMASGAFKRPVVPALFLIFTGLTPGLMMEYMTGRSLVILNEITAPPIFAALSLMPLAAALSYLCYLGGKRALPYTVPVIGLALSSVLTKVFYPLLFVTNYQMPSLPQLSYNISNTMTKPEGIPGSTIVLTLLSLAIWALSCIALFRTEKTAAGPPAIPPAPLYPAQPQNTPDPFAPLNR